jgi:murein DD-endopeptidase MepM/ murein hydrolase activator NlpD
VTPTPGCGYAEAQVLVPPTMQAVAVAKGAPAPPPQPTLTPPAAPVMAGGFLDLPIPYDGSPAEFRRLVNRSTLGGLITSYFDHEYPLYPWVWRGFQFSGNELMEAPVGTTVLAFDGARLTDDWYTGHAGFDLAPLPGKHHETPILAAADGIVERAVILSDGNHLIDLRHTVPGLGEYLTTYMHLQDDMAFGAMRMRVGTAVQAGERIGTMGTTGKSTGVHLHFEVRYDANGDGVFDRHERVDPFGYVPLETPDPWSQDASWTDAAGRPVSHAGVLSRYLWRQALGVTAQVGSEAASASLGQGGGEDTMQACVEAGTFPPGSTLLVSWAPDIAPSADAEGTGNGCVVYAQDAGGQPIRSFDPALPVTIPYTAEQVQTVDPESLAIYLYDAASGTWEALPTRVDAERRLAIADFPRPGRCALRGRPTTDRLPPRSTFALRGAADENGFYCDPVTVELGAQDEGDAGVALTRYSLDFGATWLDYVTPFTVEPGPASGMTDTLAIDLDDSVLQESGEHLILIQSEDNAGNVEFPPQVARVYMVCPTPEMSFSAEPAQITPPCCSTLQWSVANAEEVTLDGAVMGAMGDERVCPEASQTYTLRAMSRYQGETTAEATVEVFPMSVEFVASSGNLPCGQSTTVSWDLRNAREVYLDGAPVDANGSRTICLKGNATFTLRVVPFCGEDLVRTLAVKVSPLKVTFAADPPQVFAACQCSTLHWDAPNAQVVTLDGERVEARGTRQVCPKETRTYVLRAESGCCDPVESRVTVQALPLPPITFTADRTAIKAGERVTFQWAVDNVQAVYFEGEGVGGHDSRTATPASTHTYTLRVVSACGEEIRQIPITVVGDTRPPVIQVTTVGYPNYCPYPLQFQARVTDESPLRRVQVRYISGRLGSALPSEWADMSCCDPKTGDYYYQLAYQPSLYYEIQAEDAYGNVTTTDIQHVTCSP